MSAVTNILFHLPRGGAKRVLMPSMRGTTMVELIVVIILIGILSVVALPRMNLLSDGFSEVAYRDKIKATLEYARRTAVASRRVVCATVSGNALSLTIEQKTPETASGAGQCADTPGNLNLPASDNRCAGGVANRVCPSDSLTLPDAQLNFDPLGRPLNANGTVRTTDVVWTITNTQANSTTSLTVAAESGYVY